MAKKQMSFGSLMVLLVLILFLGGISIFTCEPKRDIPGYPTPTPTLTPRTSPTLLPQ